MSLLARDRCCQKYPQKRVFFYANPLTRFEKYGKILGWGEGYPQRLAAEKTLKKFKKTLDKHPSLWYNRCGRAFVKQKITSSLYYWRRATLARNKIKSSSHYYWRGCAADKKKSGSESTNKCESAPAISPKYLMHRFLSIKPSDTKTNIAERGK